MSFRAMAIVRFTLPKKDVRAGVTPTFM